MRGDSLPDSDHFARHCTPGAFSDEEDDDRTATWLKGKAFEPTTQNPNVSGLWVEHHRGDRQVQLDAVRRELHDSGRTVRPSHRLAILEVGRIKGIGTARGRGLDVIHTPEEDIPSHSEILGVPVEDRILHQKLADAATVEKAYIADESTGAAGAES